MEQKIQGCKKCRLHKNIKNYVVEKGSIHGKLIVIGEAPGRDEDIKGKPFVGRAGKLLDKMLEAINLYHVKGDVYITNIVKCRPPNNRIPFDDEISACLPYLHYQLISANTDLILTLGKTAFMALTGFEGPLKKYRGMNKTYKILIENRNIQRAFKIIPTYHPAYLLRNPNNKRKAWEDLKYLKKLLN